MVGGLSSRTGPMEEHRSFQAPMWVAQELVGADRVDHIPEHQACYQLMLFHSSYLTTLHVGSGAFAPKRSGVVLSAFRKACVEVRIHKKHGVLEADMLCRRPTQMCQLYTLQST